MMTAKKPNPHAQALGRLGGLARAKKLTAEERSELARQAGLARNQKLSAEQRRKIAALGGKSSAGKTKNKRKEQP